MIWITSRGQANAGPNDGYYNADKVVAIGVGTSGGQWATQLYVTECGLTEPQDLYLWSTEAEAWAKAAEIAAVTGRVVT